MSQNHYYSLFNLFTVSSYTNTSKFLRLFEKYPHSNLSSSLRWKIFYPIFLASKGSENQKIQNKEGYNVSLVQISASTEHISTLHLQSH